MRRFPKTFEVRQVSSRDWRMTTTGVRPGKRGKGRNPVEAVIDAARQSHGKLGVGDEIPIERWLAECGYVPAMAIDAGEAEAARLRDMAAVEEARAIKAEQDAAQLRRNTVTVEQARDMANDAVAAVTGEPNRRRGRPSWPSTHGDCPHMIGQPDSSPGCAETGKPCARRDCALASSSA